jgi:hypothetical protein
MHKIDVNKKITLVSPNVDQKFKRRLTLAWPVVSICSSKVAGLTDGIEWNGLAKETSNISWNQAIQLSEVKVSLLLRRCYSCTLEFKKYILNQRRYICYIFSYQFDRVVLLI